MIDKFFFGLPLPQSLCHPFELLQYSGNFVECINFLFVQKQREKKLVDDEVQDWFSLMGSTVCFSLLDLNDCLGLKSISWAVSGRLYFLDWLILGQLGVHGQLTIYRKNMEILHSESLKGVLRRSL